ncbi:MAG: methyltransferase domain-containing protein [Anaerolineales bacterium]|nr:methyltransferase domain-containing protein [Anaerolineales bacterium]MCS7248352.1 methyltransferase domain-containing protein [Anaerolineales bacterium]MDW8162165.1 methyltransferase domain-containing protein [Anaerolineales bacterium]MDW8446720.1 methyltransferase domain-containing protein [Anaerolineales bacterium]
MRPRLPICDYEGSDYQQSFWEKGERDYEDQVEAIAIRRLLTQPGELLLEIGAGAGRNTLRYATYRRIVLLDYSISQLEQARHRLGEGDRFLYVAADAYRLPFVAGLFDAATMIRTLHHLSEPKLALQQVRHVLKPGGIFLLEYANKQNLKAILRYLAGRQRWSPFDLSPIEFAELNFDFHPRAIRRWLEEAGFRLRRQLTVSHFRLGFLKRTVPLKLLVAMDSLLQYTGDWWQLSPSVFVLAQASGTPTTSAPDGFFACPACRGTKFEALPMQMICLNCAQSWEIRRGIYIFR